jgi:hypothetical protein
VSKPWFTAAFRFGLAIALTLLLNACSGSNERDPRGIESYVVTIDTEGDQQFRSGSYDGFEEPDLDSLEDWNGSAHLNYPSIDSAFDSVDLSDDIAGVDRWYVMAEGAAIKVLVNPQGQGVGLLTVAPGDMIEFAIDLNADEYVDVLLQSSLVDSRQTVMLSEPLGSTYLSTSINDPQALCGETITGTEVQLEPETTFNLVCPAQVPQDLVFEPGSGGIASLVEEIGSDYDVSVGYNRTSLEGQVFGGQPVQNATFCTNPEEIDNVIDIVRHDASRGIQSTIDKLNRILERVGYGGAAGGGAVGVWGRAASRAWGWVVSVINGVGAAEIRDLIRSLAAVKAEVESRLNEAQEALAAGDLDRAKQLINSAYDLWSRNTLLLQGQPEQPYELYGPDDPDYCATATPVASSPTAWRAGPCGPWEVLSAEGPFYGAWICHGTTDGCTYCQCTYGKGAIAATCLGISPIPPNPQYTIPCTWADGSPC